VGSEKPNLIWHSNSPFAGTGYGQQTALFAQRLKEHYNLSSSAFYGLEGAIVPWKGIPVLPGIGQTWGNETIEEHVRTVFGPDPRNGLVVTLMDAWVLDPNIWRRFNVASWVPIDHEPAPEPVRKFFLEGGGVPIAMSRFGQEQLADLGALYCPHGVDTEAFKPYPQDEAREATGLDPDAFIVGMVAANKGNPSRKCFDEAFQAFRIFHAQHPESKLYIHSEVSGRFQGVNLLELLDAVGVPREATVFCDQYRAVHFPFPDETMANLYSSMDVLLAASAGEGFGIPVIEAQACGTPVIVSDFSAQPELVGAGWKVEGRKWWTPIGAWQFRPDIDDIVQALQSAYRNRANPTVSDKARAHAERYDADHVLTEHMLPALDAAMERYEELKPVKVAA
jgi:glycosyltransferase involved in cell wall biosynthesis